MDLLLVRELALTVGALGLAGGSVYGAFRWIAHRVRREQAVTQLISSFPDMAEQLEAVAAEVVPNGEDMSLPPEERPLPLRTLVVRSRLEIHELSTGFEEIHRRLQERDR